MTHHLELAVGKQFVRGAIGVQRQMLGHDFAERRTDVTPAGKNFSDRAHQFFRGAFLCHVPRGAGLEDAYGKLVLRVHAQDEHRQLRARGFDFLQNVQAAATRHGDVENDDVPLLFPDLAEGFLAVAGLAEFGLLEVIGQDLLQSMPDDRVVVCDKNSHCYLIPLSPAAGAECARAPSCLRPRHR